MVAREPDQAVASADVAFESARLLGGDVRDILQNHDIEVRQILARQIDPWHRLHREVLLTRVATARPQRRRDEAS